MTIKDLTPIPRAGEMRYLISSLMRQRKWGKFPLSQPFVLFRPSMDNGGEQSTLQNSLIQILISSVNTLAGTHRNNL